MIEHYWNDITIYSVEFIAKSEFLSARKFRKTLVFPADTTKEDVIHLVPIYFQNIEKVLYVDELVEGLHLKEHCF